MSRLIATIIATEVLLVSDINFINTRDLKNKTNEILRAAEKKIFVVTRHGKPIVTIKPYSEEDLQKHPRDSLYQKLRENIGRKYPALLTMSPQELQKLADSISSKVTEFASWQEMERVAKGDRYGFS